MGNGNGSAELIEPFAAPEVFVEAFDNYEVKNGVLTCAGYREHNGIRVVMIRIVMPLAGLSPTIAKAMAAAHAVPMDGGPLAPLMRMLS